METPTTVTFDHPVPPISDPQMDTNRIYEQEHERPQQVSNDEPIQLAQNESPDVVLGAKQFDDRNGTIQARPDTEPGPSPRIAVAQPLGTWAEEPRKDADSEYSNTMQDRGQPRDLENWSNQSVAALDENPDDNMKAMMDNRAVWMKQARKNVHFQNSLGIPVTNETHNIVQAPDGAKVAFPKGTSPEVMHQEMTKWWQPRVQQASAAWDSVRHAATNAAQAIGLPSDMPEWQASTDEFMRDPIGKTGDVVGAVIGGLAHGFNSIIPNTPENQALAQRATAEWKQGNHAAAAATLTPLIGDGLAKSIKQAQSGDISGSLGTAAGVVAPFLTGEVETPKFDTTMLNVAKQRLAEKFGTVTDIPEAKARAAKMGATFKYVPVKDLIPLDVNRLSPEDRVKFNANVKKNGVREPLLVDQTPDGKYRVFDGSHRARAAQEGGVEYAPVIQFADRDVSDLVPEKPTTPAYAGEERRAGAPDQPAFAGTERRGALMSPTQIEGNLKTGQPVTTPFDNTEGAMDTINRDLATRLETPKAPTPAEDTAFFNKKEAEQAKPGVSVTEMSDRPEKKVLSIKVDGQRAGQMSMTPMPELGEGAMEVSTAQLKPEFQGKGHGGAAYQQAIEYAKSKGAKALYSDDQVSTKADRVWQSLVNRGIATEDAATGRYKIDLNASQTVGSAQGAADDTAIFQRAKAELGPNASVSDVARRAQAIKITEPQGQLGGELTKPLEVKHWSKGGVPLTETNPEKFGTGRAGAERSRASEPGFLPRTYFGMDGYKEPEVQSGLEHSATLDPKKYYDKDADPKGIWKANFKPSDKASAATNAERAVKDAGYHGYYSPDQQVAASFEKVPVKVNPEAMQLKEHSASGGSTFTPEGENLKGVDKYAVGDHPERTETVDKLTPKVLKDFKDRNADLIAEKDHSVGTWHDTKAGNHVLDISKLYDDRDEAVQAGKAANQQSIYHLGGEGEIPTGGTGKYIPEMEAARKDYNVEKDFSKDVLSGKKTVQEFPYYDSYKKTIDAESKELPKGGKVLFIGGGPMPISSMLLADKGFNVDTLELDPATARLGQQVADMSGAKTGKFIPGDARDFKNYGDYDAIVTSLEAGPESESKRAVLQNIMEQIKPGTKVLARGTAETGGEQFVNTAKSLPDNAIISKSIDTFDGLSKTHVLDKAGKPTLGDLWHDETGTYTSGAFMRYLAKNNLMSKAGSETLDAAAKKDFVPGWAEVSQFLTPEDRAQASKSVQKNVVDLVNKFNPEWVSDAAKAGSAAKGWYSRATGLIQHMFGDEAHRFTNFVASLSPQKDVEQNFTDALNFYNMWQDAGKPLGPDNEKVIRDLTERAEVGMSGQVARNQLYENLVNEVQPTGPKVSNFARNLKGNMDAVTKDRWMAYLFGNNERMFRWFKEGSPKPAVHLAADALIRAVGQSINMLPAEVQETSWSFLRTVVNLTEKEKISPKEAIGRVNDTLIREGASELTRLIADSPKVQSALNRLATATGDERFRADNLQNSPRFKQLLQEHQEQPSTGGGAGAINRAGAERGVKKAIEARSEISKAKKAKEAAPAAPKPTPKKAPKDKATEFNPEDMSENVRPALSERMRNALS